MRDAVRLRSLPSPARAFQLKLPARESRPEGPDQIGAGQDRELSIALAY